MASEILGRCACPECGFPKAHVKIKTDKVDAHPYRHCPDCGAQYFTRSDLQDANLRSKIIQSATLPAPVAAPEPIVEPPAPAKKKKIVFGVEVDA